MDVEERAKELTKHIKDPVERARKERNLIRALSLIEVEPDEPLSDDRGQHDGVPVASIENMNARENLRIGGLQAKKTLFFEEFPENIDEKGTYGYTRLIQAVVNCDFESTRSLLQRGADVNIKDNGGQTALDKAKYLNDRPLIRLLQSYA